MCFFYNAHDIPCMVPPPLIVLRSVPHFRFWQKKYYSFLDFLSFRKDDILVHLYVNELGLFTGYTIFGVIFLCCTWYTCVHHPSFHADACIFLFFTKLILFWVFVPFPYLSKNWLLGPSVWKTRQLGSITSCNGEINLSTPRYAMNPSTICHCFEICATFPSFFAKFIFLRFYVAFLYFLKEWLFGATLWKTRNMLGSITCYKIWRMIIIQCTW